MSGTLHRYDDQQEMVRVLSDKIAACLQVALDTKGGASLAVSGGSTPIPLFQKLCQTELAWEKVRITLVDERWLPSTHPDANARLVKAHLLQHQAAAAKWLSLKTDHPTPDAAIADVNNLLQAFLPFDAVVLGMGKDGHTASFFPDAEALQQALHPPAHQLCAAIESPASQYPRITLTLPAILQSRQIFVHVAGVEKQDTLERARTVGAINELPLRAVLHQSAVPVDIYYNCA